MPDVHMRPRDVLAVSVAARSKSLSAPPFLVSAVMDALFASRYSSMTSVVPGEADAYCADMARQRDSTILTSDSDLVVHDLGPRSKVILFRDWELVHLASSGKCLKAVVYHPKGIADRLGLPNLVKAAYFMDQDYHRTFAEAVRLAKSQHPTNPEYLAFVDTYGALTVYSPFSGLSRQDASQPISSILSRLDPRVSEVVHQLRVSPQQSVQTGARHSISVYLPFMIDDPTKTSSWRAGELIRQIGYSALHQVDSAISDVNEFERKGTRIAFTVLPILDEDRLLIAVETLSRRLQGTAQTPLSPAAALRLLAADCVYEWCRDNGKPLPSREEMAALVLNPREAPLTWSSVHASAQMQSIIYSLRMTRQLLQVVGALQPAHNTSDHIAEHLHLLLMSLKTMPDIAEALEGRADADMSDESRTLVMQSLARFRGAGSEETADGPAARKKRKKKKSAAAVAAAKATADTSRMGSHWGNGNVYAALDG